MHYTRFLCLDKVFYVCKADLVFRLTALCAWLSLHLEFHLVHIRQARRYFRAYRRPWSVIPGDEDQAQPGVTEVKPGKRGDTYFVSKGEGRRDRRKPGLQNRYR